MVDAPVAVYDEMYDGFSYARYAKHVERVPAASYRAPAVIDVLRRHSPGTVLFTGGGIVPAAIFNIPGLRLIHVHTGFLPHVRGADVLLWSLLARGRAGVSAFFMSPGLDDGDVLCARELDLPPVVLAAGPRPDDDTLYRAMFSFIDPLLRAELLVRDVLEPAEGDLARLEPRPQDLATGVTYHFMHRFVRTRALRLLFHDAPDASTAPTPAPSWSPRRYDKLYARVSPAAPLRFTLDARRSASPVHALGLRNRTRDYARLVNRPHLRVLHRALNEQLAEQSEKWTSYDYGEGYFYQSSAQLGITGLRDTDARVDAYGLAELLRGREVLEIGCNSGFLTLAMAATARRIVAFEINPYLVEMGKLASAYAGARNIEFRTAAFEEFSTDETFDDVVSFANHHTYDGNTRQSLEEYVARCRALTRSGGRLIFESHPPELEGNVFGHTTALIQRDFDVERDEVHQYGTHLDTGRHFIVATRR